MSGGEVRKGVGRASRPGAVGLIGLAALAGCSQHAVMGDGPRAFAITHVNVIDATGAPEQADMTVVVQGGKIAAIGKAGELAPAANLAIIDGRGKYLIPGLNDMHAHQTQDVHFNGPLLLANGVTGVRDMFADKQLAAIQERRREVARGALHPNILAAGDLVDGPDAEWPGSAKAANAAEGRALVRSAKAQGFDFVKVYGRLDRETYFAIADESRKIGIPFAGHVPNLVTASEASDAGQKSIEHLMDIPTSCSRDEAEMRRRMKAAVAAGHSSVEFLREYREAPASFDQRKCDRLYAKFRANGTWQVPTLTVLRVNAGMLDPEVYENPNIRYAPHLLAFMWGMARKGISGQITPAQATAYHRAFAFQIMLVGQMHKAGVPVMVGTDNPNPFVVPGFSIHDELGYFVRAGFTPMEALQAATLKPAEFLGRQADMGTVERGKSANLVLLDADPLVDIANTRRIDAVVLNGQFVSHDRIEALKARVLASRWWPNGAAITFIKIILGHMKFVLLGGLVVLALLIAGLWQGVRWLLRRRRAARA